MKKPDNSTPIKPMPNAFNDKVFARDYPNLHAFMFDEKWDDGTPREKGTLSMFVQLGVLKVCINDKALQRTAFLELTCWDELAGLVDSAVSSDETEWRASAKRIPY